MTDTNGCESAAAAIAPPSRHLAAAAAAAALVMLVASQLAHQRFLDHDMFHQMALARETLQMGWVPFEELFAYTPTVHPSVHHEWGTGMVLHGILQVFGTHGLVVLRIALTATVLGMALWCARRRASWPAVAAVSVIATMLAAAGYSPIRAQMFTMIFLATQLLMMDLDRQGHRWWCPAWLLMYVLWLNLHAGFVVGPALLAVHWLEQVMRTRQPQWHLIATGMATLPLVLLNPYGASYVPYLWDALTMPRPQITEWRPLWEDTAAFAFVAFAVLILVYGLMRRGWSNVPGFPVLAIIAVEAFLHQRHMALFGVAFLCYAPGYLAGTPLSRMLERHWLRHARVIGAVLALSAIRTAMVLPASPLHLELAVTSKPGQSGVVLPVGATQYLEQVGFAGKLMTPFDGSAYVMWRLGSRVKLSLDSRYEAAYAPGVLEEISEVYNAGPRWQEILKRYPPDLILVPSQRPLARALVAHPAWRRVYKDDAFEVLAPVGAVLPAVDRSGEAIDPQLVPAGGRTDQPGARSASSRNHRSTATW